MDPWITIVVLGAAIIGYAYLRPQQKSAGDTEVVSDFETALNQFAEELEEDNKELIRTIGGLKRELEAEINRLSGRIEALEKQASRSLEASEKPSFHIHAASEAASVLTAEPYTAIQEEAAAPPAVPVSTEAPIPAAEPESNIKSRYNHIFELHAGGKSIEYIAKKTGMNKGEVQLIIQLAKQEEQFRD